MLTLPISKRWFEMIRTGAKQEEYRNITPYYTKRFTNCGLLDADGQPTGKTVWICLRNGYRLESPTMHILCDVAVKAGNPEWGAAPGQQYYALQIKRVTRRDPVRIVIGGVDEDSLWSILDDVANYATELKGFQVQPDLCRFLGLDIDSVHLCKDGNELLQLSHVNSMLLHTIYIENDRQNLRPSEDVEFYSWTDHVNNMIDTKTIKENPMYFHHLMEHSVPAWIRYAELLRNLKDGCSQIRYSHSNFYANTKDADNCYDIIESGKIVGSICLSTIMCNAEVTAEYKGCRYSNNRWNGATNYAAYRLAYDVVMSILERDDPDFFDAITIRGVARTPGGEDYKDWTRGEVLAPTFRHPFYNSFCVEPADDEDLPF